MSELEHYGLSAEFSFRVDPKSRTDLSWVRSQLGGIETAVESLSSSLGNSNIASQFKSDAAQTQRATGRMTSAVDQMGDAMRAAGKRIDPLKREFRALRSEVRLVDFGDITDDRQFKKATNEVRTYITSLQRLEGQIRGDTTAEREFTAQLKQQQRVMATRIEMQEQQRIASKAAARVGEFQVVQQAGQLLVNDQLIGQAKDAINVFASFDDKMAGVAAITTATGDSLDSLREKAKYLGATTRFTASEAADAMSFLGMAGFKTEAILSGVQATLDLASAGQLDLASSADISSNVLSGMQLKVEDLGHVTDVMAKTATSANTNIQQLGVAMGYAAPNAAMFGATIEETSALIGVMSNAGIQADKAGTAARGAFIRMASPLKDGKVALQEMGITLTDEAGNMRNVIEIFNELNNRLKISPDTLKSIQDAGEDIESLGEVSQSKQIQYLKGIFGTTGISGAAAALGQIGELNRLAIATRASSSSTEQLIQYFTELRGLKLEPGQDIFAAIIAQAPSYTDAVRQIDEANLTLMQVNLKTLNSLDSRRLTEYFQQVKGISVAPGQDLLGAVTANAPDTQAALNQISTAMGQLGIEVKGQVGAARLMAQVMENNLAGSFRSLGSAMEAVQVNFIEPLTPLIRLVVDAATKFALFLANLPAPVRSAISVGAALTLGMGALAIAVGAAGVTLFGFQQAMAVTNLASVSLASNLIPLTGFFDTAQKAIVATNPLETFFQRNTQLAGDFERAATGTFDETLAGMKVLARQSLKTGQAFLIMSRSLLLSPIGLSIGGFLLLNTVLEQVVPGFNLLGTVLGAIAAPFGFVYGLLKGITHSLMDFLGLTGSGAMGAVAPIFGTITNAIELAAKSFSMFAESGERIGEQFGQAITIPFVFAGQVITTAWSRTIGFIRGILRPFADFVQHIGQLLISFLAEASPGPTYWIRTKWAMTVQYLRGLFEQIKTGAIAVGQIVVDAIGNGFRRALDIADFPLDALDNVLQQFIPTLGRLEGKIAGIGKVKRVLGGLEEAFRPLTSILDPQRANTPFLDEQSEREARRANALNEIAISAYQTSNKLVDFAEIAISVPVQIQQAWIRSVQVLQGAFNQIQGIAAAVGQQIISVFTSVLPQLPGAISIATVLAELSGIINPVEGLAIAIGNTIFGGIMESMGKSLDEVIPIFIRRFSLIAAFGGFLAQRLNFIQPLQARLIAAVAIVTGLSTFYFKNFSIDVSNLWHRTVDIIKGDLQSLAGVAKNVGLLLISFLAEASPGPTYWIRTKWAMTVQFLQGLFAQIRAAAVLVNQAFLGIGDVSADERITARQQIFEGVVLSLVSGVKSLGSVATGIEWAVIQINQAITSAIDNLDLLGFTLLTLSSLPMTLVSQLAQGFEAIIPEIAFLAGNGIPRAIAYALPGAVSLAMSTGLIQGLEKGFSAFVIGLPERSRAASQAVYQLFDTGLKQAINRGLSEGVTTFVRNLPSVFPGMEDFQFTFDFDKAYAEYERQREERVQAIVAYLQQVGVVAGEVGRQLQATLAPLLSFKIGDIFPALNFLPPLIPLFAAIVPSFQSVLEVVQSPAILGVIGFLTGTVLPTALQTLGAIASTVTLVFNAFVSLPIAAALAVITRPIVAAYREIMAFIPTIPGILGRAITQLAQTAVTATANLLRQIPYIGETVARVFLSSVEFIVAVTPVYFRLLRGLLERYFLRTIRPLIPRFQALFGQVAQGIVYAFEQGLKPLGTILFRALNPFGAFKLIGLYLRTKGFAGIFKPGLFMINPFDLFFGGVPGISTAIRFAALALYRIPFPAGIIDKKSREIFQIFAGSEAFLEAELKSRRLGRQILVPIEDILKTQPLIGRFFLQIVRGMLMINPLAQIIGRIALTTMFWYSVLKPITPEIFDAIAATKLLGVSLAPVVPILQGMRFVFVDMNEAFMSFARGIIPFMQNVQRLFNTLGTITGVIVHETVGIGSILLNIFKGTFGNLGLLVAIGFAGAIDATLIGLRAIAQLLRLKTQQYGDALVALFHGNIGPLLAQAASDVMGVIGFVIQQTLVRAWNAITSFLSATGRFVASAVAEIFLLIRHPYQEGTRLLRLFTDAVDRTLGDIVGTINTYIQQLQLDRLARFLAHYWIQIAAIVDVLLAVYGVINPLTAVVSGLIGLGLFLINEYRTGFQNLDAIIQALAHPIDLITNAIKGMIGALGFYIPPDLTNFVANFAEGFVKALPLLAGGIFLIAVLIRRNIVTAFQDVVGGVMKVVGTVMQAVDATRVFGGAVRDVATSARAQTTVGAQVHQVRRQETVLGIRNPFAYSQNEDQQRRAAMLGDERVAKSRAALRYQDEINKSLESIAKEEEREIKQLARSRNARDQILAFGGRIQREDGFSYDVAPLLEKKKGLFGTSKLELSETGRAKVAYQTRRRVTISDEDEAIEIRRQAAERSGLNTAFQVHGGQPVPDRVLKVLGSQGDYGVTNILGAFQKAMENLHVEEFQVNKLYVAEFRRPQNFPVQTPYSSASFDQQLDKFRSDPKYKNTEVIKKASTSTALEQLISGQYRASKGAHEGSSTFRSALNKKLTDVFQDMPITSESEMAAYAKRLSNKFNNNEAFLKEQTQVIHELIQKQFNQIVVAVPDFKNIEEANLAALKQEQRKVEGFHPVATNADVLTQAVRNVAGQTQSDLEQLSKTRGSLFGALFGFTGIPQLIENFQYNRRLFRRSQRVSRRVEEMARGESKERAAASAARQRGLEALMSRSDPGFTPEQSVQFYAAKQINAQEQAFIESWVKNRSFKIDISQHDAFRQEADRILTQFQGLSSSLTFNTLEDVKKFQQLLSEKIPDKERDQLKKLEQFLLHGAAQQPKGDQLSFADRDHLLEVVNKTIGTNLQAFGVAGNYQEISKVNLNNLRDKYNDTVNRLMSRFIGNGQLIAEIGGKNEYVEGAYKEIERKLGLGKATGASLRQIQNVKLQNTVRQIGVNFGLLVQDVKDRVEEFRDQVNKGLDSFESWLEAKLPFPSLATRIVDLVRNPFNTIANTIGTLYGALETNIKTTMTQLRTDFLGSSVVGRINRLNKQYSDAREASLQTILQSSKDERIANLARRNAGTGQLGRVWENLNKKQQFSDAQSGQAVTALMRGAMSEQSVRAMLEQELRRQGISRESIPVELDKIINRVGQQARYSVGDILKMRGLDASKVSKALESALSLEAKAVEQILTNQNYTARAVAPFQLFVLRDVTGILKDTFRGIGGTMIRLARPVVKDVTTALGSKNADILTGLAGATREINKYLEIGANRLETGITRIVGRNPLSSAIARFSSSLGGQTDRLAQFFDKQSQDIANQAPKSVTLRIVNAVQSIYKAVSDNLAKAYNYVQAQQGILPAIARFMGGVHDFFKGLFRNEQVEQLKRQRENAQRAYEQSFDAFSRSQSRRGMEDAQRELDALFAASPLGKTQAFFKSLPGRAFNKMGGIFEGIGERLSTFATDLRGKQVRIQEKRRGTSYGPEMYERTPMGTRRREGTQYLGRGIVGATENILPLTTKIFTSLLSVGAKTSDRLSNYFKGSALRTQSAWEQSANAITGKSWFAMVKRAVWTGVKIVTNLNHGAADVTAEAWDRSRQSVSQDMHQMGETAQATGQQIQQSMGQAATRSTGFLSKLGGSIGSVGKAGMAIGGAITGVGFGLQTAMYSLSTMGLVSEESSAQLNKFFEIFTLLGAAGGIVTPILGAIFSSLGAIGAIAGTVGTVIAGVGGAIASFVGLGSVAFAPVLLGIAAVGIAFAGLYLAIKTNFLGISTILTAPVHWIEAAWQGFVDRFGARLMPIIQPALDVAQGLINALNHNPTLRIPEAWEKAGGRITGQFFHWLDVAKWVGVAITGALVATLIGVTAAANPVLAVIAGVALGLSALSLVASKIVAGIGAILDWFKAGIAPAVKAVGVGIGTIAGPLFGLSTILVGLTTVGTLFAAVLTAPVFAPWIAGATALGGAIAGVAFIWQRFRRQPETPAPPPIEPPEEPRPGLRERAGARIREVRDAVGDRVGQVKQAGVDAAQTVAGQYQLFAGAAADIGIIRGTLQSSTSLQASLMANLEGYLSRIAQSIDSLVDFSKPRSRPEPAPEPIGTSNIVASGQVDRPNVVKQAIGQAGAAIQDTALGQNALGKILLSPILRAPLNAMGLKDAQENVAAAREKERIKQSLGQQRAGVQSGLISPLKLFTRKDEFQEAIQSQLQQRELSLAQEIIGGSQSASALVRDKYKDLVTTTTQNGQEETVLNKEGQAYLEEKLAGLISRQSGVFSQNELAATASKTGFNGTPEQLMQAALQGLRGKDKDAPSALEQAAAILPGERTDYQELASDSLSELVGVTQRIANSVEYIAALLQPKTKVPMSLASGASIPVAFQPSPPPEPAKPSLMDKAGNAFKSAFSALNIHAKTPVNTERTGIESLSAAATEIRDAVKTGDRPIEYTPIQKRIGDWLSDRFEQPKGIQARLSDQIGKPMPAQQGIDVDPTNALAASAINTKRHWDNTTNAIASNIDALVNTSADQGYELQKAVSEGSPGPTYWIRQHWQKTVNAIKGWLDGLGNSSEKTGEAVAQSLTIQEVLTDARSGIQQMGRSLLIFGGDLGNFTRRALGAVLTLNLIELGDAVHDLRGNFGYFTQGISAGFSQMTGNAIAFGMTSLAWATPFFVIFGAIAFTAAVIVANFLGLRTILTGVFRIGIGAGQILVSVLKGAGDTVKSLGTIAFGVFKALHGDFSVLDAGIAQFKASFIQMSDGVIEGLRTVGRGIRQIVTGIDEGIQQIFPSFKGIIHYVEQVSAALKDPEAIARTLAQGIIQAVEGIGRAIRSIPRLVAQGLEQAFGLVKAGINSLFLKIEQIGAYFRGLSFAEVGQRFTTEFRGLGETISCLPAKIMNAMEQLVPALKAPFNYLRQLVGTFVEEIRRSLPVGISAALGAGLDEARRCVGIFIEQLQSVVRSLFARLGLGKQFAEITTTLQSRWQQLVGFISGLNLFGSIPTDMEQFSTVFVKGVDLAHSAWTRFTSWLSASKLFPNLWAQLESLSSRFTETVASIKERWEGFRGEFATGSLLSGFFDGMRQLGTRFQDFVMNLEERWRGFARVIPGIPLFQSLFTELFVLGDRFTNLASFLERQWQRIAGFLGTTSLVGGAIASVEFLGRKFTEVIGFIRGAWEPFTSFLNSSDLFSSAFAQVRRFGESIPGLVESSKATFLQVKAFVEGIFQDLPSTMSGAIAWIEGAWREFTARFESILSPIVDFARTIAQWLIDVLNHNPTIRIPEAWQQAIANIKGFIESLVAPAQAVAERLVGVFQSATTRISEFWQGFSQVFSDRVLPALNTLKPHLDELVAGFQSFSERLQTAIAPIAERLGQAVSQVRGFIEGLSSAKPVLDSTGASAVNFGELLANGLAGAISIVERMAPAISTVLGVLGNLIIGFIEFSDRVLAGLAPTLETLQTLSSQALRFGVAFMESVGAVIIPAVKELLPVIEQLLPIFGRVATVIAAIPIGVLAGGFVSISTAIKAVLPLFEPMNERTREFLSSFGSAQDMGRVFGEILGNALSGVIGTLKTLLEMAATVGDVLTAPLKFIDAAWQGTGGEITGVLERLGAAIRENLEAPLTAIASLWTNTIGKIQNAVTGLSAKSQVEGEQIAQGVGETPARKSWQFWRRTTQAIQADVQALSEELKVEGHEIQAAIAEGSPGTTQRIRMFWAKTVDFVGEQVRSLSQVARTEGAQINEGLTNATGGINTSGLHAMESGIEGVSERNQKLAHTAQSLFTSLGSALSNFAPQLAMPLFMVNDFINAFFDIKRAIPDVRALIQGTETVTVASNTAIAVSEAAVAQAAGSSAIVLVTGATEAGAAKAAEAAVVGGANSWMAVTYGFLANAAQSAYRSMIVPLIPFLPMILGISVGIFLLYKAFQTNFSGIGDAVKGVADVITNFFGLLFSGAWQAIVSIFLTIEHQIRAIGRTLRQVGNILMEPFRPLFAAFGISGQRGLLGNAMVATVNLILLPLKLVTGAINLIINLLGGFIQGVILIGGVILNFILLPVRLINAAIYGVMMGFNSIMLGISSAINHFLVLPLSIADAVARQIGGAIAAVGRAITNFILRPFFAVENAVMRAIGPVVDFVLRSLGFIAGAAALIFAILSPGAVIGTFVTFITGASLAAKAIQFILGIPLKAIEFVWRNTIGRILSTTQGFVETTKGLGYRLKVFLSDPTVAIRESWQATVEFIQAKLSELGITAKDKGQEMSQSLVPMLPSAAKPRPGTPAPHIDNHLQTLGLSQAPQDLAGLKQAYRASARAAHPDTGGDVEQFHRVQSAYEQVKASMEAPPRSSVVTGLDQATKKVGTLSDRMRGLSSGFSSSLSSMGAAIANFSPQLAAPFFILGDFIDAIVSVGGLLPGLKAFFAGKKAATVADAAVTTVANGAIASSNLLVAGTAASTALVVTTGAETSALAVATEATAVGGANTFMAATFGMVANAARWAYTSILAPLIPLLPAILTVVAVVGLLYLAFKTNFLGIGDIVRGVVGGFLLVFGAVWGVITGIGQAIAQVFGSLFTAFGDILNAFRELGTALFQPFLPLLGLFGGGGDGGGSLGDAINATVSLILAPIKFVADALSLIIRAITFVVVGVIRLGTAIANTVLKPIANVLSFLNPVFSILKTIAGGIVGVIAGVVTLIGLIGFAATTLIPLIMTGMTAVFGMVVSGMTFLVSAALPMLIQGLLTVATVAIPLMINAFLFVSTVAIPAIVTGLTAIATTAIPLVMAGMSALIPFLITGFGFIVATVVPALIAGFTFVATVAVPAVIAGIAAIATATIPLLISLAPIIVVVLAIVAAVWLLKVAFDFVVGAIQKVAQWIGSLVGTISQFFQGLPFIGGLFGGTPNRDANTATNIQQFAGGGLVKGSGDAGIPVIAHAGEFVVTTEATQANLGVLEYLNAGGQLALPTPTVGIMPPVPLALPTPVAVPAGGAGSGSVVIENVNLNFEVQINTNNGTEAGEEFLRYIEDPRFKRAVRQSLREMVERTK